MAKQCEVIESRTHESESVYKSWLRKIGKHTYRFKTMTRSDGKYEIRVERSIGGRNRKWEPVHYWDSE
jgi:hypothetical protein